MEWMKTAKRFALDISGEVLQYIEIRCAQENGLYRFTLANTGESTVRVQAAVLFEGAHGLPADTPVYAEGLQMLSQYEGTLAEIHCMTPLSDKDHYKLPQTEGYATVYNLLLLTLPQRYALLGFASCHRFNGLFLFNRETLRVQLDMEGVAVAAGEELELERFFCAEGVDANELLSTLADRLCESHPPLPLSQLPTGWCSWYAYGSHVTEADILQNMDVMLRELPELRYVQIDDGYQAHWGDWLECNPAYGDVRASIRAIQAAGLEPALWVAPFAADAQSRVLREHPDWFVQDGTGKPLCSAEFTFPGWRDAPWYMLDGTNPDARAYIRHVFETMRKEWGVSYFKLDALLWGAFPNGVRYDTARTSVEAYRMGMQALLEGAGDDAVVLAGNSPMWSSIGVVNCMRATNDLTRVWPELRRQHREMMRRNWMHRRFWFNDPDTLTLQNVTMRQVLPDGSIVEESRFTLTPDELGFHRATVFASAGLLLSGDDMTRYTAEDIALVRKCVPPHRDNARFTDETFTVGFLPGEPAFVCLFNPDDTARELRAALPGRYTVSDYWSDEILGDFEGEIVLCLHPHSAKVLQLIRS